MEYTVRPAQSSVDIEFIWDLHIKENKIYADRYIGAPLETLRLWFDQRITQQNCFVVEKDEKKIGCYCIQELSDAVKLNSFFLIEQMQRKGIGSQLLTEILHEYRLLQKPIRIHVWKDNPVQEFWKHKGFAYISTDEDNLMMFLYHYPSSP